MIWPHGALIQIILTCEKNEWLKYTCAFSKKHCIFKVFIAMSTKISMTVYKKNNCFGRITLSAFCICDANLSVPHFKICNLHWTHHRSLCLGWHAVRGRIMFTLLLLFFFTLKSFICQQWITGDKRWWNQMEPEKECNFSNRGVEFF